MSFTPTTGRPFIPAPTPSTAIRGIARRSIRPFPKIESGHPIKHEFTRSIPTSQCIVCHIHPGTNMVASYLGYTWWDNETDGELMYPEKQHNPDRRGALSEPGSANPEAAAARGLWGDLDFLEKIGTPEFNAQLKNTQFADFHGHGWVFRAVYKRDRKGNLLDAEDHIVAADDKTSSRRPSISRTFISRKACTARTATSRRTVTATAIFTARRATPWTSIASIATAPSRRRPRCARPPRPRRQAAHDMSIAADARGPAAFLLAGR